MKFITGHICFLHVNHKINVFYNSWRRLKYDKLSIFGSLDARLPLDMQKSCDENVHRRIGDIRGDLRSKDGSHGQWSDVEFVDYFRKHGGHYRQIALIISPPARKPVVEFNP